VAGFFSQATIERVRNASDIVDVIGGYVPLKRAGTNFQALCPFHKEKTPSFNVNPQKQFFHCFGCNKGGDVFAFVQNFEAVDFGEAVKRLADRARIPLEYEHGGPDQETRDLKDQLLRLHEQITVRWQSALQNEAAGQIARDYLLRRGVSEEAVTLFRLGYAPDLWDDTVNWARSKGHETALVEKAGLILPREGGGHYDRFRGRLMFPICDEQSRVIGFSGRILTGDEKTAKYVNSPETPIFTKSKVFFGLDKTKRAILDAGSAIVCEGQLDLIACFMAGVQNIVAPQGTAFTADHARIIKRYAEEVVLCFDSDNAGQNAAVRALDSLLAAGLAIRVATVPAPHDPDSLIKASGAEAFREVIGRAEGYFDFLLRRLCILNDITTDKGRLAVIREMSEALRKTGNAVLIDTHAQKTAMRLSVAAEAVRAEFARMGRHGGVQREETPEQATSPVADTAPPSEPERWLLRIIFLQEDLPSWIVGGLDPAWVQHEGVRTTLCTRFQAQQEGTWTGFAGFLSLLSPEQQLLLTAAAAEARPVPNAERQLVDLVTRLRNQHFDREIGRLRARLNHPDTTDSERTDLVRQQTELRIAKAQPLAPPDHGD
jgi:DNA primase